MSAKIRVPFNQRESAGKGILMLAPE